MIAISRWFRRWAACFLIPGVTLCHGATIGEDAALAADAANVIVLPEPITDPIEPVNRVLWEVNKGLMEGFVQPSSKVYRLFVPKPFRTGIRNAGKNMTYPRRVINNMLQQKWTGAKDETYRFLANSIFGVGGLFDVGSRWNIPEWDADFGQTFGTWGWKPHVYLMLPLAGPSNERDAVGAVADGFVNPLAYFHPYSYITYGITYNNLADSVDDYLRISRTDFDPYYVLKYAWTLKRESRGADMSFEGPQDVPSLETLQSVFFTFQNPKFPEYRQTEQIVSRASGRRLPFSYWLQRTNAPLVYILPGLGAHRLSGGTIALAELLYQNGFSVVTTSSTFNYEFIQDGSSSALPGYVPADAKDLQTALEQMDEWLEKRYGKRIGSRALVGYSMGGFNTLFMAATEQTNRSTLEFARYVAIDAPARLDFAVSQLDEFFRAALQWPAEERTERIEKTFLKVAALSSMLNELKPDSVVPFSALESRFIIGLAFRLSLRDAIFLSQQRMNMGVLKEPVKTWRREALYREILQFSYEDYLEKFLIPYYEDHGINLRDRTVFAEAVDLQAREEALKKNSKVRVIENANDILLNEQGLNWFRTTFSDRLHVFERGGHLGNLRDPAVQQEIIKALDGLK